MLWLWQQSILASDVIEIFLDIFTGWEDLDEVTALPATLNDVMHCISVVVNSCYRQWA